MKQSMYRKFFFLIFNVPLTISGAVSFTTVRLTLSSPPHGSIIFKYGSLFVEFRKYLKVISYTTGLFSQCPMKEAPENGYLFRISPNLVKYSCKRGYVVSGPYFHECNKTTRLWKPGKKTTCRGKFFVL